MTQHKSFAHSLAATGETGFARMLIASLLCHALVVLLFSGLFVSPGPKKERPVYFVDLVNPPVENPRAGLPDGRKAETAPKEPEKPKQEKAAPAKTEPEAVKAEKAAPAKASETVQVAAAKQPPAETKPSVTKVPAKKTVAEKKTAPKPSPKTQPQSVEKDYQSSVLSAIETMRAKQAKAQGAASRKAQQEALKNKIAALTSQDSRGGGGTASDAPLGMPDGTGDEIGPSVEASLQTLFKSNWSLSKYQVARQDLETEILVAYDRQGNLIKKKIVRSSGDKIFDRSVEDAVLKAKKLPFPLPRSFEDTVTFNLRDLQQ